MRLSSLGRRIKYHPLIQVLGRNKGNPRTLVLIEPLWGIPYNLIAPFATLYMYTQGVTDVQIGTILSITMVIQVFFSFFAGILADKLGRKFTTMMGDFFGWALACLVWSVSHNFWLFLLAAILNCFEQINQTAWYCLLIEDAQPTDLVGLYTWVSIGGLVAIFFAPLSGLLVNAYSVVPVVRVLYVLFSLTMLTKSLITLKFCKETKQGQIRRAETKGVSVFHMLGEYRHLIPKLLRDKGVLKAVAVSVILYITNMVSTNFFSLYVTQRLGLSENVLALFPILNAAVMLVFMVGIQHRLSSTRFRAPLWVGLGLYCVAAVVLILSPADSLGFVLVYVFVAAVAAALVNPRKDALLQLNIDVQERARLNALIMASTILLSSPFGYLAGWLSSLDRRLPFAFTFLLFAAAMVVVGRIKEPQVGENTP
ncbi:MAG TPA: MFS transporter [Candidatus Acutalibacter pullistercoris]|uniref:MFS transporter n=1 Tax=Candidatus Acutalibacter pullistercoris TaxID=2838418 RepID=A0A9D2C0J9_9FIRM|nr:MFS transporter [Candidatus Acutalibacter pullistercoris]